MDVAISSCRTYDDGEVEASLRDALAQIDALSFVTPGMRIAIKVNLVTAMKPDTAATVHPAVVCALVRLLRERGAEVVIGDSPGGVYTAAYLRLVYDVCGMRQAEQYGAKLNDDYSVEEVEAPNAHIAKQFPFTGYLHKADAVIDLCKLKTHGMMGMSCAVKNMFGCIPGTLKPEFHYKYPRAEDFADMLVDLFEYVQPQLSICDAVVAMEGNGPTQGSPRAVGCLLASRSGHQLDAAAARLIGLSFADVPTLAAAQRRGLLPADAAEVSVSEDAERFAVMDFQTVPAQSSVNFHILGNGPIGKLFDPMLERILTPFPKLEAPHCVGCGKCGNICPAKAITMKKRRPQIDRRKCIHCFCCQEFCPKGAMTVGHTAIMRLVRKRLSH